MIQLNSRKKVIIILVGIVLIVAVLLVILLADNKKEKEAVAPNNQSVKTLPVRDMTKEEKIDVGISPDQPAEVVNDQGGLFLYRLKK